MAPTTRRQQKRYDSMMEHAGLRPSKRPRHDGKRAATPPSENQTGDITSESEPLLTQHPVEADIAWNSPMPSKLSLLRVGSASTNTLCAFLSLPRELRDCIYKHVLQSDKRSVTLQNRNFITRSGLLGTNAQIKEEFLDAALFYAPVIHTTVRNHNFAHIVTFLNRLSDAQLHKFAIACKNSESDGEGKREARKIIITLTYSRTKQSTRPQLNRWLDRFDDPNRRGAEVRFEYRLDRLSWQNGGYKQRVQGRATAGPRSREEARKIMDVTCERGRGAWGW